ncbi:MAG TPA: PAS domain-containing protein [Bryobacteraceae bacterium]|nr:PAS domain-containing protein [Bryobacteraceae bacterium]
MALALNPDIYRAVLDSLPIGVYLVDVNRQIAFWNTSAERITGYLGQEVIGRFCQDNLLVHCDENLANLCGSACPLANTMHDGRPRAASVFLRHKDGRRIPVRVRAVPIRDDFGAIVGSAEFFEERLSRETEIRARRASAGMTLDDTTELPDRHAVLGALGSALEEFATSQVPFGILCLAIDNPAHLRQFDGRQAVKAVLYAAGQTISATLRPSDMVGRWQEERFMALIACPAPEGLLNCAERVKRLVGLTGVPWWGDRLSVTVSIGGTVAQAGDTVESLTRRVEEALAASLAEGADAIQLV